MKLEPVGITRIVPKAEHHLTQYSDFIGHGCTEIRERLLKNGYKIIQGYNNSQPIATISEVITPQDWVERICFYNSDTYGAKKNLKETQLEKTIFNKIGDILSSIFLIKNYENNNLVKTQRITTDIVKGIEESKTIFTPYNTEPKYQKLGMIHKYRTSSAEYIEEGYDRKGKMVYRHFDTVDKDGNWKY